MHIACLYRTPEYNRMMKRQTVQYHESSVCGGTLIYISFEYKSPSLLFFFLFNNIFIIVAFVFNVLLVVLSLLSIVTCIFIFFILLLILFLELVRLAVLLLFLV